jgi:NADH-quinone oxidoreductase subunit H
MSVTTAVVGLLVGTGVFVIAGAYAAAVLDHLFARVVARAPLRIAGAFAAPVRESALLFLQERRSTERPDAAAWALAPSLLGGVSATAIALVLWAPLSGRPDIASGIVYFGAAMAMVMVGVYLNGWAANSVFPLIGGYRFIALALSYEMPLALVLIAAALPAQSLGVTDIVQSQHALWNVVRQPLGLPLYLIAGLGLAFRGPLALPDAADLAGGTEAELGGAALVLWRAARASVLLAVATMGAAVFLGGWLGPWLPGMMWLALKTLALLAVMVAAEHRLARMRLERFVVIAWTVLIPLALVDVFASGVLALWSAS